MISNNRALGATTSWSLLPTIHQPQTSFFSPLHSAQPLGRLGLRVTLPSEDADSARLEAIPSFHDILTFYTFVTLVGIYFIILKILQKLYLKP